MSFQVHLVVHQVPLADYLLLLAWVVVRDCWWHYWHQAAFEPLHRQNADDEPLVQDASADGGSPHLAPLGIRGWVAH